jgi:uncharacterized membrane protein
LLAGVELDIQMVEPVVELVVYYIVETTPFLLEITQ